jgi:hypothetical protein
MKIWCKIKEGEGSLKQLLVIGDSLCNNDKQKIFYLLMKFDQL